MWKNSEWFLDDVGNSIHHYYILSLSSFVPIIILMTNRLYLQYLIWKKYHSLPFLSILINISTTHFISRHFIYSFNNESLFDLILPIIKVSYIYAVSLSSLSACLYPVSFFTSNKYDWLIWFPCFWVTHAQCHVTMIVLWLDVVAWRLTIDNSE